MNTSDLWFYCSDIPAASEHVILDERESRHAGGARRLRAGDKLYLFDGKGILAETGFLEKSKNEICLEVLNREQHDRSDKTAHLACPIPKGDRVSVLLDMATQVGMTDFTPLICEFGLNKRINDSAQQRWQRVVIESCKQARRLFLPRIHEAQKLDALLQGAVENNHKVWLADAAGKSIVECQSKLGEINASSLVLVGPEGG
ncbi:MAG: 16S rRNA (uracil(1498)-N(3))-methyltransferase, partial [Gammaproteobacteria bacterium]|nr:16S rRNA (uracil(1498)-N(3))-methyltransferase [Gammaproteobacteria bacterium]